MKRVPRVPVTIPVHCISGGNFRHLCESTEIKHSYINCIRELITYRQAAKTQMSPRVNDGHAPSFKKAVSDVWNHVRVCLGTRQLWGLYSMCNVTFWAPVLPSVSSHWKRNCTESELFQPVPLCLRIAPPSTFYRSSQQTTQINGKELSLLNANSTI